MKTVSIVKDELVGQPISKATFHQGVITPGGTVESNLYRDTPNVSRRALLWWTSKGLVCLQKGTYFIVPFANVVVAYLED
jgi:hypothetical protein